MLSLSMYVHLTILNCGCATAFEMSDMVRDLNVLQNRMAMGDRDARAEAAKKFDLIDEAIPAFEPETWKQEKNTRAAAIFLLAGGAPAHLREAYDAEFLKPEYGDLMSAALEYAEAGGEGSQKLMEVDARSYSAVLAGHIALVQGVAIAEKDKGKAVGLFDLARLSAPSSLIEEAALRREIELLDLDHGAEKLITVINRYVEKYRQSPYASAFWRRVFSVTQDALKRSDRTFIEKVAAALEQGPSAERISLYLSHAHDSILNGEFSSASEAISKSESAPLDEATKQRVACYRKIIAALSEAGGDSASRLSNINVDALSHRDAELVRIARGVLSRLAQNATEQSVAEKKPEEVSTREIINASRRAIDYSEDILRQRRQK